MKKTLLALLVLAVIPSMAQAVLVNSGTIVMSNGGSTVEIDYQAHDIGGGLFRYDVYLDDPLNNSLSYFLQALGFSGNIKQDKGGFGKNLNKIVVDDNDDAVNIWDDPPNYTAAEDSYFFQPFTLNTVGSGITDSPNTNEGIQQRTYGITAGSGVDDTFDVVQIAQIVAADISIAISGGVARTGLVHTAAGNNIMWAPEPSTFALLGMGAIGLGFFVKRRRR